MVEIIETKYQVIEKIVLKIQQPLQNSCLFRLLVIYGTKYPIIASYFVNFHQNDFAALKSKKVLKDQTLH